MLKPAICVTFQEKFEFKIEVFMKLYRLFEPTIS